ncbi:MAG TPA: ABC transporter ATP-binding protein [Thermotogota bacterium]|jgi:lipoprotein-releasing system ATP-binding protein|nr:ABC transporter ATP-binding protein [Thermotogota bacterium]MDD8042124.1 ABC transporter ATP-binding protein [Thermotogota bacterium]HNR64536.1 ABC transporter ATP-binding protein [Thermotogota bacterium]HNT96487.1 ABC transporter ATP-binding protein [Thermotogota bacterium]HPB88031.1 ABC transporter ATP-binding protein [Thermotogota bacterium]
MDNQVPVMKLEGVTKFYGEEIKQQVLFGIDLELQPGSFNAIIGQSGSGKTTLLNILGLLDKPADGKVFVEGQRIDQMPLSKLASVRNRTIGFIFQFHYLLPEFTALENVLMPGWIRKYDKDPERLQRAHQLMDEVGLEKVKNNLSTKMSGGQQQRTAIARALLNNPKIILADEPTGNLDTENTEMVYKILRKVNREYGTTFVIVTHDRRVAEGADRIIEVKDGRIKMDVAARV